LFGLAEFLCHLKPLTTDSTGFSCFRDLR
jgi:hypothetical protein